METIPYSIKSSDDWLDAVYRSPLYMTGWLLWPWSNMPCAGSRASVAAPFAIGEHVLWVASTFSNGGPVIAVRVGVNAVYKNTLSVYIYIS